MARRVWHLSARNHQEAYDLWAAQFSDLALMTNRDGTATVTKMTRVAERLPLKKQSAVLDVGPGDGTLFRLIASRVNQCCGVDPSIAAIEKLRRLHGDLEGVEFACGSADHIPYQDEKFDIVVVNSVLHMFEMREDIVAALRELRRVCKPGGVVYVGEMPFRSELEKGVLRHLSRKFHEYGLSNLLRLLLTIYVKPIFRGEPILTYPATNLHVPVKEFRALCSELGLAVEEWRHQELRRESLTRNDYLLSRSH